MRLGAAFMVRLAFILGYGASALQTLSKVLSEEAHEHGFEFLTTTAGEASQHISFINSADALFIYASELVEGVEEAVKGGKAKVVVVLSDSLIHLLKASSNVLQKAWAFYKVGGEANLRSLVHLLLNELGFNVEVADLEDVPWHGILHPKIGLYSSVKEYLHKYPYASCPLVGLLFYRSYAIYGQTDHVNALVDAFEGEGLGVIPVFTYGFRDAVLKTPTAEDSISEFFFEEGKPVVEAVVDLTSFFLLDHGRWHDEGFKVASGLHLLRKLNVPIICAVTSFSQSVDEWLKDPRGVDYSTQVYRVIMPEVDGLIEPIYTAGSRRSPDGTKSYEVFSEHAKYVAGRVKMWVRLRRKPPSQRKIAVVLINPPCKGLEANVAAGAGLDVPESLVRLLQRLKALGYNVGESLPKDGKELVRMIMERKAISEFRWTSVEDIVRRGGAAAFVDAETYMQWFNELPQDVKRKMVEDWGHPLEVLQGRVEKELVGMVYEGKFVVPGILFGNVFITPQPKFGCAGPACDGKTCRVLHDPSITPPHQWLAVYRWITRVFGADMLIHFGTHGYLEFRPGKGVGLSPSCWPEISIDRVPHLYVYIVSNPMEGVIAKRRGYAAIVDHVYPPMEMAEVLDDIDGLLAQYSHAKQLGDAQRAQIIYEELLELAGKHNIALKDNDPDGVAEALHRYVSMVRGTQVNMGLHVFGHPVEDPSSLAGYVATAMAYDGHDSPSIRRVLAEYLGLDYDSMRREPLKVNRLGITNSEAVKMLHELAVNIIRDLIERSSKPGRDELLNLVNVHAEELLHKMLGVKNVA